jgi:hypothetical protein
MRAAERHGERRGNARQAGLAADGRRGARAARFRPVVLLAGLIPVAALLGPATAQAVTAAATAAGSTATARSATTEPVACGPVWTAAPAAPDPAGDTSQLLGVMRAPGGTVWAVGDMRFGGIAVVEKRTSSGWVHVPSHAPRDSMLSAVAASSASDIWAVGQQYPGTTASHPLIFHWNGSEWAPVHSPGVSTGLLDAVTVLSPDDVWAVGSRDEGRGTLTEHWNGTSWSIVPSPNHFEFNVLTAVAGSSASAVWAVGNTNGFALAEYWDGTDWRVVTVPQTVSLRALAVISASDAWAVGLSQGIAPLQAEHWNGSAWQLVLLSDSTFPNPLNGIAAAGPRDVWAVSAPDAGQSLAENFNGAAWRTVIAHSVGGSSQANAVTTLPGGGALAVGSLNPSPTTVAPHGEVWEVCPAQVTSQAFEPAAVTDAGFLAVTWRSAGHSALALRDGTGMGWIRSAPLPPGATYSYRFYASGTYPVTEAAGSARQVVSVPVNAEPATTGPTATRFVLTWAARVAPFGYVYDVRMKAPGASGFTAFRTGVSSIGTSFTPAASGTYQFEARLRKYTTGAHAGWSPPLSITVTG